MPPITAVAIGARKAPPSPTPNAEGSMPADMAIEVMTMGWARLCPASITAAMRSSPRARISMMKSIKRIAFLVTIPISIRMPIRTGIDRADPVRISAAATPPMARGSERRMVKGWMTERKRRIRTLRTSISPMIMALPKEDISSACTSASPDSVTFTPAGSGVAATISLKRSLAVPRATPKGNEAPITA